MANLVTISNPIQGSDIKLVVSGARGAEIQRALELRAKMLGRVRGYEFRGAGNISATRSQFIQPVYDLAEIARASDVEPYITQSIRKHREQILKEGYTLTGADDLMVQYVKRRLFEISLVSGITTEQWLRELVTNVVTYHNGFLVFRRDPKRSSGKPIVVYGKQLNPIAGIYVADPTTMEVSVDKYGNARRWRQKIEGFAQDDVNSEKSYNAEDVVLITVDKKSGFTYGTPYLIPVLDDIRALRKLEELSITVAAKEAFPLYHYKVGTPERPAQVYEGTGNEVDEVMSQVASLPAQGYVVSSERHEIKLISREGSAMDLVPYLEYFEARVLAGLRLSPLDLGRGGTANRGTATNINKGLQDSSKDYQQVISDHLTNYVILPLLLEGGFDVTFENMVRFEFPMIDREEERAAQNHGLQLFMGNTIDQTEFRKHYLKKEPMSQEQMNNTSMRHQTEAQKELIRTQGQYKSTGSSGSSNSLGIQSVKNQIGNRARPANQHGVKPTKTKITANDYSSNLNNLFGDIKQKFLNKATGNVLDKEVADELLQDFVKDAVDISRPYVLEKIQEGLDKGEKDFERSSPDVDFDSQDIGKRSIERFFFNFINKSFWKVINPYKERIYVAISKDEDNNINLPKLVMTLEAVRDALSRLASDQLLTSERFGFIKFAKRMGSKTIELVNPDTGTSSELDISNLIYKEFIPTPDNETHYLQFPKAQES